MQESTALVELRHNKTICVLGQTSIWFLKGDLKNASTERIDTKTSESLSGHHIHYAAATKLSLNSKD
ncbi:hypothetical protein DPMN_031310 [Dreissena polymorpha]|uniref:Uncharacterized protein n=1 Tax=Dreissena polymorpha TaxID=45954 RepID=A0A9D4RJ69_DREPO|nr:hypothetical protein DPMN_031310 [Dreissena polymorpha]